MPVVHGEHGNAVTAPRLDQICKHTLLSDALTGYAQYSSVGRVQLQYAERFVFCPLLQALVRIEVHDRVRPLDDSSAATCGDRPTVYGRRQIQHSGRRHRRRRTTIRDGRSTGEIRLKIKSEILLFKKKKTLMNGLTEIDDGHAQTAYLGKCGADEVTRRTNVEDTTVLTRFSVAKIATRRWWWKPADGRGIRFRRVITNNPRSRYGTADYRQRTTAAAG